MDRDRSIEALERRYVRAERAFCQRCENDTPQIIVAITSWTHLDICSICWTRNRIDIREPTEREREYIQEFYWDDTEGDDDSYAWADEIWGQGRD